MAYNGVVYILESKLYDVDLMYHEAVHILEQREMGPVLWTALYVTTPEFKRKAEERGNAIQNRVRVDQNTSGLSNLSVKPK